MRTLLRHAAAGGIASSYTQRLLAAFDGSAQPVSTAAQAAPGLAEPLTGREVEILRLIATGMRNQEIADHLFISLSTVAWFQAAGLRRSVVLTSQPWDQLTPGSRKETCSWRGQRPPHRSTTHARRNRRHVTPISP